MHIQDHSGYGLGKWEERLHINASSHWLSTYAAWSNNDLLERHAKGKLKCNTTIKTDIHKLFTNCLFLNCDKKTGLNWSSSYQHQIALESHIGQSICLINNTSSQWPRLQRPRYVNVPAGYGFFFNTWSQVPRDFARSYRPFWMTSPGPEDYQKSW